MCYVGPTVAAILITLLWKSNKMPKTFWLMLMFYGTALFGIIDHLWNRELFLITPNWLKDVTLGIVIIAGTILAWLGIITLIKRNPSLNSFS